MNIHFVLISKLIIFLFFGFSTISRSADTSSKYVGLNTEMNNLDFFTPPSSEVSNDYAAVNYKFAKYLGHLSDRGIAYAFMPNFSPVPSEYFFIIIFSVFANAEQNNLKLVLLAEDQDEAEMFSKLLKERTSTNSGKKRQDMRGRIRICTGKIDEIIRYLNRVNNSGKNLKKLSVLTFGDSGAFVEEKKSSESETDPMFIPNDELNRFLGFIDPLFDINNLIKRTGQAQLDERAMQNNKGKFVQKLKVLLGQVDNSNLNFICEPTALKITPTIGFLKYLPSAFITNRQGSMAKIPWSELDRLHSQNGISLSAFELAAFIKHEFKDAHLSECYSYLYQYMRHKPPSPSKGDDLDAIVGNPLLCPVTIKETGDLYEKDVFLIFIYVFGKGPKEENILSKDDAVEDMENFTIDYLNRAIDNTDITDLIHRLEQIRKAKKNDNLQDDAAELFKKYYKMLSLLVDKEREPRAKERSSEIRKSYGDWFKKKFPDCSLDY